MSKTLCDAFEKKDCLDPNCDRRGTITYHYGDKIENWTVEVKCKHYEYLQKKN